MTTGYDVVVVGGGIVGASTAYHLATNGAKTALVERDLLGSSNATGKSGGLIRMYHNDFEQSLLAHKSFTYYAHWKDLIGGDCGFTACGLLVLVGPEQRQLLARNIDTLRRMGVAIEEMVPSDLTSLQPFMSLDGVGGAAYEPQSGFADPLLAARGFALKAKELGAVVMEGTACRDLALDGSRFRGVVLDHDTLHANRVILCNGIWAKDLAARLRVYLPLQSQRIAIQFVRYAPSFQGQLMAYSDRVFHAYYRAEHGRSLLVGLTLDQQMMAPDSKGGMDRDELEDARTVLGRRFPCFSDAVYSGQRVGMDGYTPDKRLILDWMPGVEGILLAVGLSGGGFKMAPIIGKLAAEMALGAQSTMDCSSFRMSRFVTDVVPADRINQDSL